MRQRLYGGLLVATAALLAGGGAARGQDTTYAYPGLPAENVPLPLGNPGTHGFYTFAEMLYYTQTRGLGDQTVAVRGLIDSLGNVTGVPGSLIGSGKEALNTRDLPRRGYEPGFTVGGGYKLDDGTSIYGNYTHVVGVNYHAGATLVTPFFRGSPDLSDTFLTSGVYNFPPQFSGPLVKSTFDAPNGGQIPVGPNGNTLTAGGALTGGNFYGIWNGASVMDIQYNQWFNQAEIGVRTPLFQTEMSRIYGLGGARFDQFMERFKWRTVSYDINGTAGPQDVANYNNTLSQRMYGPFVGCGHEVYLGKRFSVSLDTTAALLLSIAKERAKYELGDRSPNAIENKLSRDEFNIVPSFTGNLNLWWYPIEGVQVRAGYNALTFFNTKYMSQPIGFNYSSIDPAYDTKVFRIVHGINVGLGLFF